jgi:hypothetical protein
MSVYGTPSEAPSGIKNCRDCADRRAEQSYLSVVAAAWGADPQTLIQPRPDSYPRAYALGITLPGQLYDNSEYGITLPPGFSGNVRINGVIPGYAATATFSNPLLVVNTFALAPYGNPSLSIANISINAATPPNTYFLQVTPSAQAGGQVLQGPLVVS